MAEPNTALGRSMDNSIAPWLTCNEASLVISQRDSKQNPFRLIAIGYGISDAKIKRIFAVILPKNTSDCIHSVQDTLALPSITKKHDLKRNTKNSTKCIRGLLSKSGYNVVVDTIERQIFTDSYIILHNFEKQNLNKTHKLHHVTSQNQWKPIISGVIIETVKQGLETLTNM